MVSAPIVSRRTCRNFNFRQNVSQAYVLQMGEVSAKPIGYLKKETQIKIMNRAHKKPAPEFSLIDDLTLPAEVAATICRGNAERLFWGGKAGKSTPPGVPGGERGR